MLRQRLLSFCPFSSSVPSPSFSLPPYSSASPAGLLASYNKSSQVEMESFDGVDSMDFPELEEVTLLNEKGNLFTEEFLVDELLDLKGLPEPEMGEEVMVEARRGAAVVTVEKKEALQLPEISLPEETEAANLEWLSRFVDDCHSEYPPMPLAAAPMDRRAGIPKARSSLSVAKNINMEPLIPVKAKRSKRTRTACAPWSLSWPLLLGDTSSLSSISTAISSPSPSSSSSSYISYDPLATFSFLDDNPTPPKQQGPKKRGRKPKNPLASGDRRCSHCGVQKTPQWRAGPHGPKTLCNACGVRFKSGRLLPEYRPACSPTFVSNVHSNSHRKVLEMRRKKEENLFSVSAPPVPSC
ncbi:hypothetical protein HPP92_014027 [Vanilla planifolia]|uniref:GATA-type domain-containing protein n=1 Tax=Vanilla planifolia TaxID=51239 RepID=A0A835QJD9_VANPL|nr:hypothetical protein HPP92_014460 [Vanilla planifolia]KAG0474341.1 hypothetical protein HPP92_014027 [Vanilla planifolia]